MKMFKHQVGNNVRKNKSRKRIKATNVRVGEAKDEEAECEWRLRSFFFHLEIVECCRK